MCGIAGAIGWVDDAVVEAVGQANAFQTHRGPDGEGQWRYPDAGAGPGVVLAHRRLSILDLSPSGAQPMHDERSGCVIAFNGEVYNFASLREELVTLGHRFRSGTDTEVILKAYAQWGPAATSRFNGMFALAIWDPAKQTVFLARDRMGIKPLYVAVVERPGGRTLLFASELRALLTGGLVQRRLDPVGLSSYLWQGFVYGPSTMVKGVSLLPAATRAVVDPADPVVNPQPYWSMTDLGLAPANPEADLQAELQRSVSARLVADVPVGVFLSGGVDSSAVAACAVRAGHGEIRTFNIGFDEADYDESGYARAVAEQLGTRHTEITLTSDIFRGQLDAAMGAIDQPTFDGLNTYFVSRAVRDAGVTVALAGTGGDELFAGYKSFADLPRAGDRARSLRHLPAGVIRALGAAVVRARYGRPGVLPPQVRYGKLADLLLTRGDLSAMYQVSYGLYTRDLHRRLLSGSVSADAAYGVPLERLDRLRDVVAGRPPLDGISLLELQSFIGERLLRDTDTASMAASLEVRVPLLDHQFVERALAVDADTRCRPLGRKQMLRRIALQDLDPAIFDRPKSGFVMPFEVWCRAALKESIRETLHDRSACHAVGLDPDVVAKVYTAVMDGAPGFYWSRLWALYILLRWSAAWGLSR